MAEDAARPVKEISPTAARLSLAAAATFLVLLVALHFLKPGLDPSWRMVSEYEIGRYGWVMVLAFLALASSGSSLAGHPGGQPATIHQGGLTPMAGTHVEANGIRVYYEVYGGGEPLLLLHGGTATSRSWSSHLPAFIEHFRVFAPDSRGHGRTDNPTGELDYRVMADDVAALIKALGLQRPLILGYSDGGQITLELGMRYPGLARALVLGGTQFRFSEAYLEAARTLLGITEGEEPDPERLEREQPYFVAYLREAHAHVYGPEYWKTYVKQMAALWLRPQCYTSNDLAAVTDPVLILVGDRDGACTEEAPDLLRLLSNAELAVAPGSDHGFIETKAGLFDALALDFLVRHRNDPARVPG